MLLHYASEKEKEVEEAKAEVDVEVEVGAQRLSNTKAEPAVATKKEEEEELLFTDPKEEPDAEVEAIPVSNSD